MARKRPRTAKPQGGSAYLVAWVTQKPGQEPKLERVEILSERNPTRMFPRQGSGQTLPHIIHVTSTTERDFAAARAKLIRRLRHAKAFVWLLPWLIHWEGNRSAPPPSASRPMSLAKAIAQAD